MRKLLTISTNPKTRKGEKYGYLTAILHLAPASLSGFNTCKDSTAACRAVCLNTAGRGGIFKKGETSNPIQAARIWRTEYLFENKLMFLWKLHKELTAFVKKAHKADLIPAIRLNGTSDLPWEKLGRWIFNAFKDVQFYDYTKSTKRALASVQDPSWPKNYDLTYSRHDEDKGEAKMMIRSGVRVAAVYRSLPTSRRVFKDFGASMTDGDIHDLTFLAPLGHVLTLKAKGKARQDTSGFVLES